MTSADLGPPYHYYVAHCGSDDSSEIWSCGVSHEQALVNSKAFLEEAGIDRADRSVED